MDSSKQDTNLVNTIVLPQHGHKDIRRDIIAIMKRLDEQKLNHQQFESKTAQLKIESKK